MSSTTVGGFPGSQDNGPDQFGVTSTSISGLSGNNTGPAGNDITLQAIEVTQGLQNLDNDFPLLANRPTWVRVHGHTEPGTSLGGVRAAVLGVRDGVELGVEFSQNVAGLTDHMDRYTHQRSPYVLIPSDWTNQPGELTLWVTLYQESDADNSDDANPADNISQVTVNLHQSDAVTLHYWPIYYEEDGVDVTYHASDGYLAEHLTTYRIWPVAHLNPVPHATVVGDSDSDFDVSEGGQSSGPNLALAELHEATYGEGGEDQIYVGMLPWNIDAKFWGFASAGTTWARMGTGFNGWNNNSGWTVAHEAGHFAGLKHAPCKFNPGSPLPGEAHGGAYDPSFPASYSWPNCSLAPPDPEGYFGFDILPTLADLPHPALPSNNNTTEQAAFPWMGYLGPAWTDPWHGCVMLEYLGVPCEQEGQVPLDPDAPNGGHVPSGTSGGIPKFTCDDIALGDDHDFCDLQLGPSGDPTEAPPHDSDLLISGMIDPESGEFELFRAMMLPETGELDGSLVADPALDGPYVLALVDDGGSVKWATSIEVDDPEAHGDTERPITAFHHRFPNVVDGDSIVIVGQGGVLASLERSPSAPVVDELSVAVTDQLQVDVEASDADGDALVTSVHYRPGADAPWTPLVASASGTSFTLADMRDLAGSNEGMVRVLVSDGFNTTVADRSGLVVPDPAPMLSLWSPVDGAVVPARRWVELQSTVTDADGADTVTVSWESSVDGPLGSGANLSRNDLSEGQHVISAIAVDGAGNVTSESVNLTIAPTDLPPADVQADVASVLSVAAFGGDAEALGGLESLGADDDGGGFAGLGTLGGGLLGAGGVLLAVGAVTVARRRLGYRS